jgi:hypothetical protein
VSHSILCQLPPKVNPATDLGKKCRESPTNSTGAPHGSPPAHAPPSAERRFLHTFWMTSMQAVDVEDRDDGQFSRARPAQLLACQQLGDILGAGEVWERITTGGVGVPLLALESSGRVERPTLVAEVALVRAERPALEPRPHSTRVRETACLRPLARPRQRTRGVHRRQARDQRALPARAAWPLSKPGGRDEAPRPPVIHERVGSDAAPTRSSPRPRRRSTSRRRSSDQAGSSPSQA